MSSQIGDILTDEALEQINIEMHATLEFSAEKVSQLMTTIHSLKAERDEYKRRYEQMVDIYQSDKYSEGQQ